MAQSESEPANSSSGEEEEASSEGTDSESEPDKTSTPTPTPTPSSKKTQLTHNSSSDTDSASEPKPMDDDQQLKKSRSKNPTARYSPPPIKSLAGKRPAAEGEAADLKRVKKELVIAVAAPDADNGGEEKKQLFQRLWSEENEIELIQGMIDFVNEKGKDPVADVNNFHEFVKNSLHVDVNNKQVIAKARRLKKKYENNVARAKNTGKVRTFSNPHEKKMYELSTNLWGNDSNKNSVMKSSTTKKVNVTPKPNKNRKSNVHGGVDFEPKVKVTPIEPKVASSHGLYHGHGSMGFMITDEVIMNKGLELLSGPKRVEMEEKWRNLKVQELEHFLKKVELLKEQGEIVLNAMVKPGDN